MLYEKYMRVRDNKQNVMVQNNVLINLMDDEIVMANLMTLNITSLTVFIFRGFARNVCNGFLGKF